MLCVVDLLLARGKVEHDYMCYNCSDTNLGHGGAAAARTAGQAWCTVCSVAYEQCVTYPANC